MIEQIALFATSIVLFIYIILSSITLGSSVFILFPQLLQSEQTKRFISHPILEISQIFLILFILLFYGFFPGAIAPAYSFFFIPFLIGLFFFIIREVCIFLFREERWKHVKVLSYILLIASFLSAISYGIFFSFSALDNAINLSIAILFTSFIILCTLLISGTFIRYFEHVRYGIKSNPSLDTFIHEVGLFLSLFVIVSPAILLKFTPYMLLDVVKDTVCGLVVLISFIIFFFLHKKPDFEATFLSAGLIVESVFFSLVALHVPYIFYPDTTIYTASTTNELGSITFWGVTAASLLLMGITGIYLRALHKR